MNILRHKKWHVRTKENIARVRRDEAKAADEEKAKLERQILAENERRLKALRQRADERTESMFGRSTDGPRNDDATVQADTGHVNFFQDLEREERKNLGTGNKEYEDEKKKEQQEWESKMGIQKMLGEGTNELDKKAEWYEKMPLRTNKDVKPVQYVLPQLAKKAEEERKTEEERGRKRKRKKDKKKRRHRSFSSSSSSEEDRKRKKKKKKRGKREDSDDERKKYEAEKQQRLAALRDERMKRERQERLRTEQLLHPEKFKPPPAAPKQKYNSQFNPDLCRK